MKNTIVIFTAFFIAIIFLLQETKYEIRYEAHKYIGNQSIIANRDLLDNLSPPKIMWSTTNDRTGEQQIMEMTENSLTINGVKINTKTEGKKVFNFFVDMIKYSGCKK